MLATLIDEVRQHCEEALRQPELVAAGDALQRSGTPLAQSLGLVHSVTESEQSQQSIKDLKAAITRFGLSADEVALERFLLIQSAVQALDKLREIPVSASVKELFCQQFLLFATPDEAWKPLFRVGQPSFVAMCKLASLRRFPAGQLDWEVSGLPRSCLLRVAWRDLPRVLHYVATRLKGLAPAFVSHMPLHKKNRLLLLEKEMNRSYYRMAKALQLQPWVKGYVAASWIRSPDTHRVSPHLAWVNKVHLENGGLVALMGPADPNSGVFTRSRNRRELYEAGQFKPTVGLVLWGRSEMIGWAATHPEFGE